MNDFYLLTFQLLVLVMSVVIHEVSHGIVALWQGDPTAKLAGRLTINPMKHLDPLGSFLVPVGLFIISRGSFVFGWAKPVPYNPYNLRNQKWGSAMVGLAGPFANFSIAILFGLFVRFLPLQSGFPFIQNVFQLFVLIVMLNVFLGVFNLVPIPPLDGSKLLFSFLPASMSSARIFLERNGFLVLLFFLFFGFQLISPIVGVLFRLITGIGA
ncbi:MAG: site-2 protease family protein [Candidatus Spechtbacteria bacterium]|nr:site-2 protease family protein [Candidatus Spechtbacteria bacterium]